MDWNSIQLTEKEDRAVSCLLGLAIGDALGSTQEIFLGPPHTPDEVHAAVLAQRRERRQTRGLQTEMEGGGPFAPDPENTFEPGDFTDDTSMALCLADTLIMFHRVELVDLAARFVLWCYHGYNASRYVVESRDGRLVGHAWGIGRIVRKSLDRFRASPTNDPVQGSTDPSDATNGTIMRLAPVPIFYSTLPEGGESLTLAIAEARLQCQVTHHLLEVEDACAYLTSILFKALQGHPKDSAMVFDHPSELHTETIRELTLPDASWRHKREDEVRTLPGTCRNTLEASLWVIHHTMGFEQALVTAVNLGGDADTVAAVTGQIAGALYGSAQIPQRWSSSLKHVEKIRRKAIALVRRLPYSMELALP